MGCWGASPRNGENVGAENMFETGTGLKIGTGAGVKFGAWVSVGSCTGLRVWVSAIVDTVTTLVVGAVTTVEAMVGNIARSWLENGLVARIVVLDTFMAGFSTGKDELCVIAWTVDGAKDWI